MMTKTYFSWLCSPNLEQLSSSYNVENILWAIMMEKYICVVNLKDNLADNFRSLPVFLKGFKAFPLFLFLCAKSNS